MNPAERYTKFYSLFITLFRCYIEDLQIAPDLIPQPMGNSQARLDAKLQEHAAACATILTNEHCINGVADPNEPDRLIFSLGFWTGVYQALRPVQFDIQADVWSYQFPRNPEARIAPDSLFAQTLRKIVSAIYLVQDEDGPREEAHHELIEDIIASINDSMGFGTVLQFCRTQLVFQRVTHYSCLHQPQAAND